MQFETIAPEKSCHSSRSERVNCNFAASVDGTDAIVKNLSATGMYLELGNLQDPDSRIKLSIDLSTPSGLFQFEIVGEIVRVDKKVGKSGYGIKIVDQVVR